MDTPTNQPLDTQANPDVRLQVLICTFGRRLMSIDIDALPKLDEVSYVISCQDPDGELEGADIRPFYVRRDIDLRIYSDRGISNNRNHALAAASAPYLLIADDDIEFIADGLMSIIKAFDDDPTLDIAAFRSIHPGLSRYPAVKCDLSPSPLIHEPISFEIAIRRSSVERLKLQFSPLAGIGAPRLGCGEENLFIHTARRRSASIMFFPTDIVIHPGETTSTRMATDPSVLRAKGTVITALRGPFVALTRFPVEAWRSKAPFHKALWRYIQGMTYFYRHRSRLL